MKQKLRVLCLLLLFCTAGLAVNAQMLASYKENQGRGYGEKNVKLLKHALIELENKFKVSIAYRTDLVDRRKVDLKSARFATLESALEYLLKDSNLEYKKMKDDVYVISEKVEPQSSLQSLEKRAFNAEDFSQASTERSSSLENLSKKSFSISSVALDKDVTGKVTSENGEGIPGVNVIVKGSTIGATTDAEGNFKLTVPDNAVLVFSYVGFTTQEIEVGAQSSINVSMTADIKSLNEVVVIGYGEKSRKMLTESIGTVNSTAIEKLPVASADAAIQGRVSGVQITSVDGTPGAPVNVRIRGIGTVGNTQPLFVIDGVPVGNGSDRFDRTNPLSAINPNDIESISVLKDASAAAVYGVRAANGVVIITTKRGKSGKAKIALDSYYGVQNFPQLYEWNNTEEYINLRQESLDARNTQNGVTPGQPGYQTIHPDLLPGSIYRNRNTDWQSELINKNASIQSHTLTASGGTENINYYVSGGYFRQEAIVKRWDLERFSFRANADYKLSKKLRAGNTLTLTHQSVERGMNGGGDGFLLSTAGLPPFFEIYDTDQSVFPNRYGFDGNQNVGGLNIANQYALNELVKNTDRSTRLLGSLYGEFDILKSLTFRTVASLDYTTGQNTEWVPGVTNAEVGFDRPINNYNDGRNQRNNQVFTNTLTFHNTIGDHGINVLAGIEYQRLRNNGISVKGQNFLSPDPTFYIDPRNQRNEGRYDVGGSNGQDAYVGYVGRVSYDYKQKYLLTATVRRDGTAHFSEENRWGTFPSVSAAWRVSEEPFFQAVPVISDLKLRGSWGQLGNANTGQYSHYGRISTTPNYSLGGVNLQAFTQTNITNPNIQWETVESTDLGFDVSLFNNKVDFLFTYYQRVTKDFLYELPTPGTAGFANIWGVGSNANYPVNAGSVRNSGIELELGYKTKIINDLNFNVSGNLTTIKNELTELAPGFNQFGLFGFDEQIYYRTAVGYPIGYFYGYKTAGIYQTDEQANAALPDEVAGKQPRPGDVIFVDTGSPKPEGGEQGTFGGPDGKITEDDRVLLGKTIPDFFYGISLGADFKGVDLSILFQGVSGVQIFNHFRREHTLLGSTARTNGDPSNGRNQLAETKERWTGTGTSNSMPRAIEGDPNKNARFSDRFVEDAGFFRLKNIQLGYTLPTSLLGKTKAISNLRIYLSATNLLTLTGYSGLDPEVATYGKVETQIEAGTDRGNMPQPRTFTGGIQVQF